MLSYIQLLSLLRMLSDLPPNELTVYCEHLKTKEPKSLEEAVYNI